VEVGFGLRIPLAILAAIAYALGWIPNQQFGGRINRPTQPAKTPLEIAQERYARGEITQAEYEEMRRELSV
jgi:uncharacterized membrane protein